MKRERERESGSEGGRLRGSVGPPQRERWLPSLKSSPASCPAPQLLPTLPQAAAGGSAIPAPAKAGKGGKGTGVRCTTGLPGPSTTRATTAATRPGAGRLRRPWVRALVRLEYPSSSGTWGEGPNRAQGCPPPPPSLFGGAGEGAWLQLLGDLPGLRTRSTHLRPARQKEPPSERENGKVGVSRA